MDDDMSPRFAWPAFAPCDGMCGEEIGDRCGREEGSQVGGRLFVEVDRYAIASLPLFWGVESGNSMGLILDARSPFFAHGLFSDHYPFAPLVLREIMAYGCVGELPGRTGQIELRSYDDIPIIESSTEALRKPYVVSECF